MMHVLKLVLTLIVVIGAINWLVYAFDSKRGLVHRVLGNKDDTMSKSEKAVYILVGLSGIALLVLKSYWIYQHGLKH